MDASPSTTVVRYADLPETLWPNGRGTLREIASAPDPAGVHGFSWRISIATVAGGEPFSALPGIDRVHMPLTAGGLTLDVEGAPRVLAQYDVAEFGGEDTVVATVPGASALALNVMVDRRLVTARLEVVEVRGSWTGGSVTLTGVMLLSGSAEFDGVALQPFDTVVSAGPPLTLTGDGVCALIRVDPVADSGSP